MHPAIKLGDNRAEKHIDGWIETMRNLAANGLEVICYNFMPVVDWTRTDLRYPARRGGLALRFDPVEFAVTSADVETTLVVYMGLGTLPRLTERLLESGFPASMPAVAIERGTTADERRVFSSLASLPDAAAASALVSPTLIVVGRTVALSPLWPYATDAETRGLDAYEPSKWTEQRGTPREDADDWKAWLSASVDFSAPRQTRRIHADSAF